MSIGTAGPVVGRHLFSKDPFMQMRPGGWALLACRAVETASYLGFWETGLTFSQ